MKYLGATHLHSTYSYDGKLTLLELREVLRLHNISFACVTEHTDELTAERAQAFVAECATLSSGDFLFIPGFEVSYKASGSLTRGKDTHILMFGCETFIAQHATDEELVEWKKQAQLAILAHPHRNGYKTEHIPKGVLDGIEIWNAQYDGKQVPRTASRHLFERMREEEPTLLAFAGWDFHRVAHAGGPGVTVEVPKLTQEAVLTAIKNGDYLLESSRVGLDSRGRIVRGDESGVARTSAFVVAGIRLGKVVNRVLSWFGLRLPSKLVGIVRRSM